MSLIDLGIVLFVIALAAVGYQRGLIASALPLIGFVGGAALGARIGPALLAQGAESRYAPLVAMISGLLTGAFLAVALDGFTKRLGRRRPGSVGRRLDGAGGSVLLAALGLLLCWGFGAVALHTGGNSARGLREAVQRSAILGELNDVLPPSGPLLHVLRRVDPTPAVRGPSADVSPPQASSSTTRRPGRRADRPSACSAPPAGSASRARAGSRAPASSSPTPTSSPARTTRP